MSAHVKTTGPSPTLLGLSCVLVGSLPRTLMTSDAPDRYTVEVAFTRRADRDEVAAIEGNATRAHLTANGFSTVELHVSDRRLQIANTNLEELRDGLAAVIVERLADICTALQAERALTPHRVRDVSDLERARAAAVVALAQSVLFEDDMALPIDASRGARTPTSFGAEATS